MLKKIFFLLLALPWLALQAYAQEAIIIDHTCTDLSQVPDYWIQQAKTNLRIGYGHTSHGSQLVTGIEAFRGDPGSLYYFTYSGWGLQPGVFLNDYWGNAGGADDLGHNGELGWRDATLAMLGIPGNDRNVVMWSWCGGVSDNTAAGIDTYLDAMNRLEQSYPGVTFVYMTGHLDGTGTGGSLDVHNERIRAYCIANNKILFDFADIESYNPDGDYFLNRGADDGCYYDGGNWSDQWIAANPGSQLAGLASGCDSCAHSRRLNCVLKGRAFWWMMARTAGWDGSAGPSLSVTSPAAGKTYGPGSRLPVSWTSSGIIGTVKIKLVRSDKSGSYLIAAAAPNNGSPYYYTIPREVTPGSYFVRVKQGTVYGRCGDFSIGVITVGSPTAGQTYYLGEPLPVAWTSDGITGNVKILLKRADGTGVYVIAPAVSCGGSPINYTIPGTVTPGVYFIKIKKEKAYGKSANFTIAAPFITVDTPAAGGIYSSGSRLTINWTAGGISGNVSIVLKRADKTASYTITPGTPYISSPYYYTISAAVTAGVYFIRVKKPGCASGKSANFSIN